MYNILIADDDPWMLEYLVKCIEWEKAGIQSAIEAGSGEEASEILKKQQIDIVISDVKMGAKDGIELLREIRDEYPYIKVILLSGIDSARNVRAAFRLGVVDFLFKPVEPEALKELVCYTVKSIEREKGRRAVIELLRGRSDKFDYMPAWTDDGQAKRVYIFRGNTTAMQEEIRNSFEQKGNAVVEVIDNRLVMIYESWENQEIIPLQFCLPQGAVCAGISGLFYKIQEVKSAFDEAKEALDYQFYDESTHVFCYSNNQENEKVFHLLQNTSLFQNIVMAGKYEEGLALLDTIFQCLYSVRPPLITVHAVMLRIIDVLYNMVDKSNLNPQQVFSGDYTLQKHYEKLQFRSLPEMEQWLLSCFTHCMDSLDKRGGSSKRKVIEDIEKIINQNLDKEISLDKIATQMYLNPSYLSRLFKENVGKSYTKYVMEKRIEKAKILLREENYKIYEIAELVGYDNTKYFNKIFKELVGITPKEYREG